MSLYSQFGEDGQVILPFFEENPPCHKVFCDVGAFDGIIGSNSRALFEMGWTGVVIEPGPVPHEKLAKLYEGTDVLVLNKAVAAQAGMEVDLLYPVSNYGDLQLSTTKPIEKERWPHLNDWRSTKATTIRLADALGMLKDPIDFLSIDAEGMDFEVLMSADLDKAQHLPRLIIYEHNDNRHGALGLADKHLGGFGYRRIFKNIVNAVWVLGGAA